MANSPFFINQSSETATEWMSWLLAHQSPPKSFGRLAPQHAWRVDGLSGMRNQNLNLNY